MAKRCTGVPAVWLPQVWREWLIPRVLAISARTRRRSVNQNVESFVVKGFGSAGRTRTYNPSVNSRMAYSRLALQTQDLDALETNSAGIWGDFGGTRAGAN